jgi:hypothetical protein
MAKADVAVVGAGLKEAPTGFDVTRKIRAARKTEYHMILDLS